VAWIEAAIAVNVTHGVGSQWRDYQLKSCTRTFVADRSMEIFPTPHSEFAVLSLRIELSRISVGEAYDRHATNAVLEEP